MRIESLILFLKVVDEGTVSKAARDSFISQQGLSRILKELEKEFDIVLFSHEGNQLKLTAYGAQFARVARNVVESYNQLWSVGLSTAEGNGEVAPISEIIVTPLSLSILSPFIEYYADAYKSTTPTPCVRERGLFDVLNTMGNLPENSICMIEVPSFMTKINQRIEEDFIPIVTSEVQLCCSKDSEFARRGKPVTPTDLRAAPIVLYNEELLGRVVRHIDATHLPRNVLLQTSNEAFLHDKIVANEAVSFADSLSVYLAEEYDCAVVSFEEPVYLNVGVLSHANTSRERAQDFARQMRGYLKSFCSPYMVKYGCCPLKPHLKEHKRDD